MESKKLAVTAFISRHAGMLGMLAWVCLWTWLGYGHHVPLLIALYALAASTGLWAGRYDIISRKYRLLTETVGPLRQGNNLCDFCDGFYSDNPLAVLHHEITEHTA